MKERPILFSAPMVRAILSGKKTQTRRIVKNAFEGEGIHINNCPYGTVGDRLWVRETYTEQWIEDDDELPFKDGRPFNLIYSEPDDGYMGGLLPHYRATDPEPTLQCENPKCRVCENGGDGPHWRPGIHMPRWASRILLEIVSIRVEQLQEITESDAQAEGVTDECPIGHIQAYQKGPFTYCYAQLWDSINGKGSWDQNPWVWVIDFKRVNGALAQFDAHFVGGAV